MLPDGPRRRSDYLPIPPQELNRRVAVLRDVVEIVHDQLITYKTEPKQIDWPRFNIRYDAHFRIPRRGAVMEITSLGDPNEESASGLFVTIFTKSVDDILMQLLSIQMPKEKSLVSTTHTNMINMSSEKLELLFRTIQGATPISVEEYDQFTGTPLPSIIPVGTF